MAELRKIEAAIGRALTLCEICDCAEYILRGGTVRELLRDWGAAFAAARKGGAA